MKLRSPPRIVHGENKPDFSEIPDIIDKVRINISLCSQEYRLLLFYASSGSGFRPAKKMIQKSTGIDKSNIKKVRNSLVQMNLIDYQCNQYYHFIFVNWTVIIGYALLDRPLKAGGKGRRHFVRCDFSQYNRHPYHDVWKDYINNLKQLTYYETVGILNENVDSAFRHMNRLEKKDFFA